MDERDWQQIWDLYEKARNLNAEAQDALLHSVEPHIAARLQKLLREAIPPPAIGAGAGIGPYFITGVLGRLGIGEMYAARGVETGRQVALKILPHSAADSGGMDRCVAELEAASALGHPSIVTVVDVVRSAKSVAIVMEAITGQVLRELRGRGLSLTRVLRIGEQIAGALAAAHAHGIVHGGLNPDNIMVGASDLTKILDFGLPRNLFTGAARAQAASSEALRYLPPEEATGEVSPAFDLFPLGVMLFELVAGVHPFPAATPREASTAIRSSEPLELSRLNPHVPAELSDLVARMLRKNAAERPSAREVAERLTLLSHPAQSSAIHKVIHSQRRHVLRWGLGAAATVGAGIAGWRWMRVTSPEATGRLEATPVMGAGSALESAVSPDCQSIAFVSAEGKFIQVKDGAGEPVRLSPDNDDQGSPTWSPDGRSIAFLSVSGARRTELRIVAASGGTGRKVAEFATPPLAQFWFPGPLLAWSPNPDWLAVSARLLSSGSFCLFLVHAVTGELRQLTDPRGVEAGDTGPAFSPDGRMLAFSRVADEYSECHLYVLPLRAGLEPAGQPRRIETGQSWNTCPVWTPDGRELIFSTGSFYATKLARIVPSAVQPRAVSVGPIGDLGWMPSIGARSDGGSLLTFTRRLNTSAIWKQNLAMRGDVPVSVGRPVRLVAARGMNFGPVCAPSGGRFAFISTRSGFSEVWVSETGGKEPEQWTNLQSAEISDLRWLGSNEVMFDVLTGGVKVRYRTGPPPNLPRKLFSEAVRSGVASPDGKWVYYLRRRITEIWRRQADGAGDAVRVTEDSGYNFQISRDGNTIYYAKVRDGEVWIWAVSPWAENAGGRAPRPMIPATDSFCPGRRGIYFVPISGSARLAYFNFSSGLTTPIVMPAETKPRYMIAVTADETAVLYSESEAENYPLMAVSDFR